MWSLLDLRLQKLEVEEEEGKGKESIGFHGSLPCISFRSPLYGSSIGEQQVADLRHWKCLPLLPSSLYFSRICRESDFDIFPYMQCQHFTPEYKNSIWMDEVILNVSFQTLTHSHTHFLSLSLSLSLSLTHTHIIFLFEHIYTHITQHTHNHTQSHTKHTNTHTHTLYTHTLSLTHSHIHTRMLKELHTYLQNDLFVPFSGVDLNNLTPLNYWQTILFDKRTA